MGVRRTILEAELQEFDGPALQRFKDQAEQMQGVIDKMTEELLQFSSNWKRRRVSFSNDNLDGS
eukprot:5640693-Amphidinium_carterae.1